MLQSLKHQGPSSSFTFVPETYDANSLITSLSTVVFIVIVILFIIMLLFSLCYEVVSLIIEVFIVSRDLCLQCKVDFPVFASRPKQVTSSRINN